MKIVTITILFLLLFVGDLAYWFDINIFFLIPVASIIASVVVLFFNSDYGADDFFIFLIFFIIVSTTAFTLRFEIINGEINNSYIEKEQVINLNEPVRASFIVRESDLGNYLKNELKK
jgi:hypothetical protein